MSCERGQELIYFDDSRLKEIRLKNKIKFYIVSNFLHSSILSLTFLIISVLVRFFHGSQFERLRTRSHFARISSVLVRLKSLSVKGLARKM